LPLGALSSVFRDKPNCLTLPMTSERLPLLDQCTLEVERCAPALLQRCVDAAVAAMQSAENASQSVEQRQRLAQAALSLTQNRSALIRTYPRRLREAIVQVDEDQGMSRFVGMSDSSMLQLVDDAAVTESLEAVRLLQNLLPMVEQVLPVLDARMSSLIGLNSVQVEKNPLRPSMFVRELRDLVVELEPDAAVRSLWLQHIAPALGRELALLYEQIALLLQRANVQEASYRIRPVEDAEPGRSASCSSFTPIEMDQIGSGWGAPGSRSGTGSGRGAGSETGPGAQISMQALGRARSPLGGTVYQAFLHSRSPGFDAPLDPSFYQQVDQALAQVDARASEKTPADEDLAREQTRYQDLPAVDRPAREIGIDSPLRADRWGAYGQAHERTRVLLELKQQAQQVAQAVGLDLVRKLVSQVARDPLLLAPVREAVVALEPALLRLALDAPRYFGEANHPARRLVEQVAQRSFRFNDEFADDFAAFIEPVREAVNQLNAADTPDAEPFAQALEGLSARWRAEDSAEQAAHDEQLQALRFAQDRQELADHVAWEISLRPDVFNAPEVVLDFLYGSWSLVIASAHLRQIDKTDPDPAGYRSAVGTLLWSVRPEILRQPKQVFEALPGLLRTLNAGLAMLGKPAEKTQSFFDALIRLHQPLLNLRRTRAQSDAAHSGPASLAPTDGDLVEPVKRVVGNGTRPVPAEQPWLTAQELAGAGFDDAVALPEERIEALAESLVAEVPLPQAPKQESELAGSAVAAVIGQLSQGVRVDLFSKGVWIRAELVWASNRSTLFMFTSHGGRVHSMTLRSCEKLVHKRLLRLVVTRAVVEAALKAVGEELADPALVVEA
jgi:Asp-tRNA(Asn)/Glu-tRNA(Gln) amidotransferase C subunit